MFVAVVSLSVRLMNGTAGGVEIRALSQHTRVSKPFSLATTLWLISPNSGAMIPRLVSGPKLVPSSAVRCPMFGLAASHSLTSPLRVHR